MTSHQNIMKFIFLTTIDLQSDILPSVVGKLFLIDPLCSRHWTQENNNYCDVIFAASFCSFCCQSFSTHSRLFDGVPNYVYNICIAHNIPKSIASHNLVSKHILLPYSRGPECFRNHLYWIMRRLHVFPLPIIWYYLLCLRGVTSYFFLNFFSPVKTFFWETELQKSILAYGIIV